MWWCHKLQTSVLVVIIYTSPLGRRRYVNCYCKFASFLGVIILIFIIYSLFSVPSHRFLYCFFYPKPLQCMFFFSIFFFCCCIDSNFPTLGLRIFFFLLFSFFSFSFSALSPSCREANLGTCVDTLPVHPGSDQEMNHHPHWHLCLWAMQSPDSTWCVCVFVMCEEAPAEKLQGDTPLWPLQAYMLL